MILGACVFLIGTIFGYVLRAPEECLPRVQTMKDAVHKAISKNEIQFVDTEEKDLLKQPIHVP